MIIKYNNKDHYELLCKWFKERDMSIPREDILSDCGFIVNNNCIGFLFKTNSKQCYIDNVIVDPKTSDKERDISLFTLFEHLEEIAKEEGNLLMFAMIEFPNMKRRFKELNYTEYKNYTLFYKPLQDGVLCLGLQR